ncbi:MAG: glycosyltransferase [Bifidobacteriaceae bacterium]|jgi:glycosyltransferase involved in cell wall biosynthesis|nr:glycosyltransferase [Bifidobacteriaceae bacterium]
MPRQPHIAYIAWGFPPSRSGGVYRQLATANALAAAGWSVTVLTVERRVFTDITGADESLEARVDPRVEVLRTRFDWPLRDQDRATWPLRRRVWPRAWRKARVAYELAVFPEVGYATWLKTLRGALAELHRRRPIDLVMASGNPFAAFAAAYRFHRRASVPYVLDYRDSWILDQFTGAQRFPDRSRQARWERRLIAAAAQVWFVNPATLEWHAARYPQAAARFRVVANGWDPESLAPPAPSGSASPATPSDAVSPAGGAGGGGRPLTFGYLGTITAKVPVAQLLEGWRLAKADGLTPADARLVVAGYLGYFGGRPDQRRDPTAAALEAARPDGVEFVGPVPKGEVAAFYAALDGLVLAIDAGPHVTTGKVFEYAALGKPIVSVHPPEADASRVLDGHPLWAPVAALTAPEVAAAFGRAAALAQGLTPAQTAAALAFGQRFTRQRQLGPAIAGLKNLL